METRRVVYARRAHSQNRRDANSRQGFRRLGLGVGTRLVVMTPGQPTTFDGATCVSVAFAITLSRVTLAANGSALRVLGGVARARGVPTDTVSEGAMLIANPSA
jgi:hypothetical protein